MGKKIAYARVSREEQNLTLQIDAFDKYGVDKIYHEKVSALKNRSVFNSMIKSLASGDTLVIWSLDRLGRNVVEQIPLIDKLVKKGVTIHSIIEKLTISDKYTEQTFTAYLHSVFAHNEKQRNRERTMAGLAAARERGRIGGRKKGLTPQALKIAEEAQKMRVAHPEYTPEQCAKKLGINRSTFYRYLKVDIYKSKE